MYFWRATPRRVWYNPLPSVVPVSKSVGVANCEISEGREVKSIRVIGLALGLLAPSGALAAGFQSIEQGTWDIGRALVGAASAADSAATVFYNPAGMTLIEDTEIVGGLMGVLVDIEFDTEPGTTFTGGGTGNAASNAVVPAGPFFVHPVNEQLSVGFSFTAPFVGSLDYGRSWAGRYIAREVDRAMYRASPAVAYRVNDWLSLGASVAINYTRFDFKVAIPTPGPDGKLKVDKSDQWQWSFSLGAMIELQEGTRLGINYFSEVENHDLGGDIETTLPGLLPGFSDRVNIEFTLPQGAVASLRQEITDDLVLYFDLGWADFSSFSAISVDVSGGTTVNANIHFRDITFGGIGGEYWINDLWTWQFGAQYASAPVGGSDRNPALAFDRQIRYATGVRYEWSESLTLALSYEFADFGSNNVNVQGFGGVLKGDYDPNHAHFIALTARHKF